MSINLATLIQGGLVWMATDTWSSIGREAIDKYYPETDSVMAHVIYACIVSLMVVLIIWIIRKITEVPVDKITDKVQDINKYIGVPSIK